MIVCVCRSVSDRQIRQAAADGARTLEDLQIDLGVAMQCGRCADCAMNVLTDALEACAAAQQPALAEAPVRLVRHAA